MADEETRDEFEAFAGVRAPHEAHRERARMVMVMLPVPEQVVFDASEPGVQLIDVIEATAQIETERDLSPSDTWVRLPRGYATVEFLRMLFAVSG